MNQLARRGTCCKAMSLPQSLSSRYLGRVCAFPVVALFLWATNSFAERQWDSFSMDNSMENFKFTTKGHGLAEEDEQEYEAFRGSKTCDSRLFAIGDLHPGDYPMGDRMSIVRDPCAFQGTWEVVLSRSEPIDGIMDALGFSPMRQRFMQSYTSTTTYDIDRRSQNFLIATIATKLPMGNSRKGDILFDCQRHAVNDAGTGIWDTVSHWDNGRMLQRRDGERGIMYDTRVVYPRDPEGIEKGPIQIFKWSFVPFTSGIPMAAIRIMRQVSPLSPDGRGTC